MSSKLMDTEPGGESTQYESIDTVNKGHSKQGGQLGNVETRDATGRKDLKLDNERGQRTAENIRYGQSISEEGMGGQTSGFEGEANREVGQGGVDADRDAEKTDDSRNAQGYGSGEGINGQPIGA